MLSVVSTLYPYPGKCLCICSIAGAHWCELQLALGVLCQQWLSFLLAGRSQAMLSGRSNSSGANPFSNRRGAGLYGSSRFHTSPRLRKQHFLSFRNARRQTPNPQRTQEVFERLLKGLE